MARPAWLTLGQPHQQEPQTGLSLRDTHRIPLHTPIHPRRKILVSTDIDIQAIGLITPTSLIGWDVRLAIILRISGGTCIYYFDDDTSIDLVIGRRAVEADVVDSVAGTALNGDWGAGGRDIAGGWILATVRCAERGFQSDEHRKRVLYRGARKDDASSETRDAPDASIVFKVHVWLATHAQACRDIFADITGGGGEDVRVVCVT